MVSRYGDWRGIKGIQRRPNICSRLGLLFQISVERMRADLERYASGFLRGDVSAFHRVRAETNRTREPYRIHTPNGDGTYRTEVDPDSAELKARFS